MSEWHIDNVDQVQRILKNGVHLSFQETLNKLILFEAEIELLKKENANTQSLLKDATELFNEQLNTAWDINKKINAQLEVANHVVEAANKKYLNLIMEVSNKWPNETRHDTAKRYIREAETSDNKPYMDSTNNA